MAPLLLALLFSVTPLFNVRAADVAVSQPTDYVIKLHTGNSETLKGVASQVEHLFEGKTDPLFRNIYRFSSSATLTELRSQLAHSYDYLEYDHPMSTGTVTVNDPGFTLNPSNTDKQWGLAKAGFPQAWDKTTGSVNTVVAVIDTGVAADHEDLAAVKFLTGYDFLTQTSISPGTDTDDNGHGTLVTGVIAAKPNNNIGIAGTNWQISILPIKALNAQGAGSSSDIASAIVWAVDHGAHIINLSLGGLGFSHDTTLANSVTYAFRKNAIIVAAAGNDVATQGSSLDVAPVFPICDDNSENMIIGVAATDSNDVKYDYSNYGKSCLDVSAPGRRILSTINRDPFTQAPAEDSYAYASGTSLAVPFVVGQAALLKSLFPDATNKQIRDRIITTSDSIDFLNPSQCNGSCAGLLGTGRINVLRSLEQQIVTIKINDADLVTADNQIVYYINGGKRQRVSAFVRNQRFPSAAVKKVNADDLAPFPEGPYAEPLEGTLIKSPASSTVYYMGKGIKQPITYQVFLLRNFNFSSIAQLTNEEVNSWLTGSFLAPPEGSVVRSPKHPQVYWVIGGVLHPVNYNFYIQQGLHVIPITIVSDNDIKSFTKGNAYVQ